MAVSGGFTVQPWELCFQRAKKVVSDSQGLVDFATGLVNSVLIKLTQQAGKILGGNQITEEL